jgi:ferredoxin-fold anticodon binding domain-containing protein
MLTKLKIDLTNLTVESTNENVMVNSITQTDSIIELEILSIYQETPYQAIMHGFNNISPIG